MDGEDGDITTPAGTAALIFLLSHAISEHDHDGELAREDHEHETLANEDHEHDFNDDVARIVRNKLIEAFEEIASNI